MILKPSDLPEGSKVELTVEDGYWRADFFPEHHVNICTGSGLADDIVTAVLDALDEAGDAS